MTIETLISVLKNYPPQLPVNIQLHADGRGSQDFEISEVLEAVDGTLSPEEREENIKYIALQAIIKKGAVNVRQILPV